MKRVRKTVKLFPEFGVLQVRVRPHPTDRFDDDCFYFQQGTTRSWRPTRGSWVPAPARQRVASLKALSRA